MVFLVNLTCTYRSYLSFFALIQIKLKGLVGLYSHIEYKGLT